MATTPNIILIPLLHRLTLTTSGGPLTKASLDLNVPQVRNQLALADGIFVIGLTEGVASADFEWMVAFYSGFDRDHQQATPIDLSATTFTSATVQGVRTPEYTTTTNFLLESRLQLWWRNPSGVSGAKAGIVSAVLGLRMST
jgi:hypothetical protein